MQNALCPDTRRDAAQARQTMLSGFGADRIGACDFESARWAMNELGSGPGFQRISQAWDAENRARQAINAYASARANGNRSAMRQAAVEARDDAQCHETQSIAGNNVEDYNAAAQQQQSQQAARQSGGAFGGSTQGGAQSGVFGSGGGSAAGGGFDTGGQGGGSGGGDPQCRVLQAEMERLAPRAQQIARQMQQAAAGGGANADQIQGMQGEMLQISGRLQEIRGDFMSRGCDRAAVADNAYCQNLLQRVNQGERQTKQLMAQAQGATTQAQIEGYLRAAQRKGDETNALSRELQANCLR